MPNPPPNTNAKQLAKMRRKYRWALAWLISWLVFTPLACFIPCTIGIALGGGTTSQVLGIAAFISSLVGLAGIMLKFLDWRKYRAVVELIEKADEIGFRVAEKDEKVWYASQLETFQSYSDRDSEVTVLDLLVGNWEGVPVAIMQSFYTVGHGAQRSIHMNSVTLMLHGGMGLPEFVLARKTWQVKILLFLRLGKSIEIPNQPAFNSRFVLGGPYPPAILRVFTPPVVQNLLAEEDLAIEVNNGRMAVMVEEKVTDPEEIPEYLQRAVRLSRLFPRLQPQS